MKHVAVLLLYLSVELDGEDFGVELPARDFGALVEVTDAKGARVVPRHDGHKAAREQPLGDVDGPAYCKIQWIFSYLSLIIN